MKQAKSKPSLSTARNSMTSWPIFAHRTLRRRTRMDEKLIETLREFAEAIKQLRRDVRELQTLKDTVADLRQRVAALEKRTVDRDLAGAVDQLRREVDELK